MITNCSKCNTEIHWDNNVKPPEGSQRAKTGKSGWFIEKDGTLHTLDKCSGGGSKPTASNEYEFIVPAVQVDVHMHSSAQLVKMAMVAANDIVKTQYPNLTNENVKGQIRSRLVDQLLSVYKNNN